MPTIPSGAESTIAYLSGITNTGRVAATSFWTWKVDSIPATYVSTSHAGKWGSATIGSSGSINYYFDPASQWTSAEQSAFLAGLAIWTSEVNITVSQTTSVSSANMIFYRYTDAASPYSTHAGTAKTAYSWQVDPSSTVVGSSTDGQFHHSETVWNAPAYMQLSLNFDSQGGYGWQAIVHEFGHMIGLGHAGPYNGTVNPSTQQFSNYDSTAWSIMSYMAPFDTTAKYYSSYPVTVNWGTVHYYAETPMILDILAAQQIYGAATSGPLALGGQVFGFHSNVAGAAHNIFDFTTNPHPVLTIWDGGLNNTLDLSGFSVKETVNLNAGTFSSVNGQTNNVAIAEDTRIDKVICGSGSDTIYGNPYDNIITPGGGNDTVDGGSGTDTVILSGNRSAYTITTLSSTSVRVSGLDGTDTLSNVEKLQFNDQTVTVGTDTTVYAGDVVYQKMYGATPGSTEHTTLDNFYHNQYSYAQQAGVAHPLWSGYEAIGTALAEGSDTGSTAFKSNWGLGALNDSNFISQAYTNVFSAAIDSAHISFYSSQLAYYESFYSSIYGSTRGYLIARGNVYGLMLGVKASPSGNGALPLNATDAAASDTSVVSIDSFFNTDGTMVAGIPTNSSPNDDYADSVTDTTHSFGNVTVGGSITGTLEVVGDHDLFRVQLTAGNTYIIDLQGQTAGSGTLSDPYLRLRDSTGLVVAENDDGNAGTTLDSEITFTATTNGTYYVDAAAYSDNYTGTYKITVAATPLRVDDYANSLTDTAHPFGVVAINGSSTGTLETIGDHDLFKVQLTAGTNYLIDLQGQHAGAGTLSDPLLILRDSTSAIIRWNDDTVLISNPDSELLFTPSTSGTYYIDAGAYGDNYTGTYKVSVTVTVPPADDYANSLTDTTHPFGVVAVNGSTTGNLAITGDRDWFTVQLTAGNAYMLDLQGQQAGAGTLADPYLRLHDSTGALLAFNDDIVPSENTDSEIYYRVSSSGTYYIEASAYGDTYTGTYKVSVTAAPLPADDYANSLTDTTHPFGVIAVNGSSTGTLEVMSDRDWFKVQLTAGTAYVIDLQGQEDRAGTVPDPHLRLHDSTGALLDQNDDITYQVNPDSELVFTASTSGTYYIEAGAFSDSYSGTYKVSVAVYGDDYADTLTDTTHPFGVIAVNGSSTGKLEVAGDLDWFKVQLTAGTAYTIDLQGQHAGTGTLVDPTLLLHDSNGVVVAQNDDVDLANNNFDSQITFTPTTSGTYYVDASAYADSYTGTYKVSLSTSTGAVSINPDLVYQKLYGVAPSSAEHNALVQFDTAQYATGQQIGVADPILFVYQALGLALAEGSDTGSTAFKTTWGPTSITSDTTFVSQAYTDVFGHAGSAAQVQQFVSQVNFFVSIYTASGTYGTDTNRIDLLARGAVYGQMIGVLAESSSSATIISAAEINSTPAKVVGISDGLDVSHLAAAA